MISELALLEIRFLVQKKNVCGDVVREVSVVGFAEFPPLHLYKAWQMPA